MKATVYRSMALYLLASSLFLTACGSSNSSSPNPAAGNIPNLATKPTPQASPLKTQRFAGDVINAVTRAPIDRAEILLQVKSASPASSSPSTTPAPTPIPTPPPAGSGTAPVSAPTPAPNSQASVTPNVTPGVTPSVTPSTGFSVEGAIPSLPGGSGTPLPPSSNNTVQPDSSSLNPFQERAIPVSERYVMSQSTSVDSAGFNTFETNTNNRGKFFVNDVPEGQYILSVSAPGYRSITLTDVDPNRLEIPLIPLENMETMDIVGSVLSPTEKPVANAYVSSSFPMGDAIGIPATTNTLGEFKLPAVPFGRRSFIAFVQNVDGDIQQMGLLKNIIVNNKSIKDQELVFKEKPDTLPGPDGTPRPTAEELIENVNKILTEEVEPSPSPEGEDISPYASESPEETPASEESPLVAPPIEPYPAPSVGTVEENQESTEKKGSNLFDTVKNFFTGEEADESEAVKISPVISLRSVISSVSLSGEVTLPEGYTLKSMDVYLTLEGEEKEAIPEEFYLLSKTFPKAAQASQSLLGETKPNAKASAKPTPAKPAANANEPQPFEVRLPTPGPGQKYHLQFTATQAEGGQTYHHIYNLDGESDSLKVDFLPVMQKIEIQGESDNTIPSSPRLGWEPVSGAEAYHVTLTAGNGTKRRVIWEAWTKSTQIDYPFSSRTQRLQEQETYVVSVAALKGLKPIVNKSKNTTAHAGYQALWSDLSRFTHTPFEVVNR